MTGWSYRQAVTFSNPGAALSNYQVKVSVDTVTPIGQGNMKSDGSDIRFTDAGGTTLLSYYLEASTVNQASTPTVVWVDVVTISAGSNTLYMYYGNAGASAVSSAGQTFVPNVVQDPDFTGAGSSWTSESCTGGGCPTGYPAMPGNISNCAPSGSGAAVVDIQRIGNPVNGSASGFCQSVTFPSGSNYQVLVDINGCTQGASNGYAFVSTQGLQSTVITQYTGANLTLDVPSSSSVAGGYSGPFCVGIGLNAGNGSYEAAFGNLRIRKLASPDVSVGSEAGSPQQVCP